MTSDNPAETYMSKAIGVLERIRKTQMEAIERAAEICADTIAGDGLVHLFGTGHSRILIEEMFPRYGSFPGFHPIVELSLTYHNQVIGSNGQRQALYLEHVEGLGEVILQNFVFAPPDSFIVFSNSGTGEVNVEVALGAKKRGMPLIAVVSCEHCEGSPPRHSSGKRLIDAADIVIDNCVQGGDAMVSIEGVSDPVGPGSTVAGAAIVNAMKSLIAEKLAQRGKPPCVLTSSFLIGSEASARRFDACYEQYRVRIKRVFGCEEG